MVTLYFIIVLFELVQCSDPFGFSIPPPHLSSQWPPYDPVNWPQQWPGLNLSLSSGAQRNTIAYANFAWVTGNLCADTFLPPGKVADIYGFQYLRDGTPSGLGHNSAFAMAISAIVLNNLTTTQLGWLKELANLEVSYLNDTVISRQPFQGALRSYLENPSLGLDYEKVIEYAAKMWDSDANLTLLRGEYYGKVIRDLSPVQIAYWNTWYNYTIWTFPNINVLMDNIHTILNGLTNDQSVEVQTFADDIFVQVTQPIYGDVYWAPERVSDYFGAFYLKDLGVVGVPNYTISVNATLNGGELFLDVAGPDAKKQINDVTTMETTWLYDWVTVRTMVATELRKWHTHGNINQTYVREYLHLNGMYDGMIAYLYAKAFTDIGLGLNSTQMSSLQANREPPFDITVCYTTGGAFFFAELKFDEPQVGNPPLDLFNDSTTSQDSLESWDSSAVSAGFTTEPAVVLFLLLFAIKTLACV